jgi:putative sterol carrier protein
MSQSVSYCYPHTWWHISAHNARSFSRGNTVKFRNSERLNARQSNCVSAGLYNSSTHITRLKVKRNSTLSRARIFNLKTNEFHAMVSGDFTTCMAFISGKYRIHKDLSYEYLGGITRTAEGFKTWR